MKWYFALNELGTTGEIALHTRFAVLSAIRNTTLEPVLLYAGRRNDFTEWLRNNGVAIIDTSLPYMDIIVNLVNQGRYTMATVGHWMRTNVCLIEQDDEFVLYTDVDVLFCRNPDLDGIRPRIFAAAPEFQQWSSNYFNSGVMVMNVPALRRDYGEFESYLSRNIAEKTYQFHDQLAYNTFYRGRWDRLPLELNWKPYWGANGKTSLLHFHGPKIAAMESILAGQWNWASDHGRQIGSLFAGFPDDYRYHVGLVLKHTSGLDERDMVRIAALLKKIDDYDGRLNGEIDLSFTDFRMFPEP